MAAIDLTRLKTRLKEYIDETENQGPEFSEDFLENVQESSEEELPQLIFTEVARFLDDFLIYVEETEKLGGSREIC